MSFDNYYPFSAAPLTYGNEGLKPYISEYTLYFHHDRHYKSGVDRLNALLKDKPLLHNIPLEALTKSDDADIRANAGGVYNHGIYFSSFSPNGSATSEKMRGLIERGFGSEKAMWDELISAGAGFSGVGFVWIVLTHDGALKVLVTPDLETIDFDKYTPVFNIDVWEHAYYLDRQNNRAEYMNGLRNIIDWEGIEKRLNE